MDMAMLPLITAYFQILVLIRFLQNSTGKTVQWGAQLPHRPARTVNSSAALYQFGQFQIDKTKELPPA